MNLLLSYSMKNTSSRVHHFNRLSKKVKPPNKKKKNTAPKVLWKSRGTDSGFGLPNENITNPTNGHFYVDQDSGDAYLFVAKLGWVNLNSWQPDVGEGPPDEDNPLNPLSGDQYLDVLTGDFYVFSEGLGWVLNNGIEGPPGPPGESFSFELMTTSGPTGPTISGPITVTPGKTVRLWLSSEGQLQADVI